MVFILGFLDIVKPVNALLPDYSPNTYHIYHTYVWPAFIALAIACIMVATIVLFGALCRTKRCCQISLISIYPFFNLAIILLFGAVYLAFEYKLRSIMTNDLYCSEVNSLYSFCAGSASTAADLKKCQYAVPDRFDRMLLSSFAYLSTVAVILATLPRQVDAVQRVFAPH